MFPTKTLYAPLISQCLLHASPISFFLIGTRICGADYRSWSPSLCSFYTSSLSGPNIFLSTIFSNTLSLFYVVCCSYSAVSCH